MSDQLQATGRVISNFAWQHLKAATIFRDQVNAVESQNMVQPLGEFFVDIRAYGSACIMSAAASIEALINEFSWLLKDRFATASQTFEIDFWGRGGVEWKPPLEKYQLALEMLGQPRLDEQSLPFRDAWWLIELRNALVHYKPTWDPHRKRRIELIDVLENKFDLSPFADSG